MGYAEDRLTAKRARIAEVKALNLRVGDWVTTNGTTIYRATKDALDARSRQFQGLRRASEMQIAKRLEHDARRDVMQKERDAMRAQEDYRLGARFASTETEMWQKLDIAKLRIIATWLNEVSA